MQSRVAEGGADSTPRRLEATAHGSAHSTRAGVRPATDCIDGAFPWGELLWLDGIRVVKGTPGSTDLL